MALPDPDAAEAIVNQGALDVARQESAEDPAPMVDAPEPPMALKEAEVGFKAVVCALVRKTMSRRPMVLSTMETVAGVEEPATASSLPAT